MNSITRLYSAIWMGVCGILMKISNVEVHSIINILDNYYLHVIRAECNFSVLKKHLFFHRVSKKILFSKHNFAIIWFSGLFWHFCSPDHLSQDFFVEKFQFWNFFFFVLRAMLTMLATFRHPDLFTISVIVNKSGFSRRWLSASKYIGSISISIPVCVSVCIQYISGHCMIMKVSQAFQWEKVQLSLVNPSTASPKYIQDMNFVLSVSVDGLAPNSVISRCSTDYKVTQALSEILWLLVILNHLVWEDAFIQHGHQNDTKYYDTWNVNSLAPERIESNFRYATVKLILVIDGWGCSLEIALSWR